MSEINISYLGGGVMFLLALATTLYSIGGRANGRIFRRLLSPLTLSLTFSAVSLFLRVWQPLLLIVCGIFFVEMTLGYGVGKEGTFSAIIPKWVKRILISLLVLCAGLLCVFCFGKGVYLLLIQGLVALTTVVFAFRSPLPASIEEILVCFLNNGIILFFPFVK